jgi:hypothetical protein
MSRSKVTGFEGTPEGTLVVNIMRGTVFRTDGWRRNGV